jgi:hypothetical protein
MVLILSKKDILTRLNMVRKAFFDP